MWDIVIYVQQCSFRTDLHIILTIRADGVVMSFNLLENKCKLDTNCTEHDSIRYICIYIYI